MKRGEKLPKSGRHTVNRNVTARGSERWGHNVLENRSHVPIYGVHTHMESQENRKSCNRVGTNSKSVLTPKLEI